nr:MAG TPA: hypothetical protein [Caudoviricetes sp.]
MRDIDLVKLAESDPETLSQMSETQLAEYLDFDD